MHHESVPQDVSASSPSRVSRIPSFIEDLQGKKLNTLDSISRILGQALRCILAQEHHLTRHCGVVMHVFSRDP